MTDFTITITDTDMLAGLTGEKDRHNSNPNNGADYVPMDEGQYLQFLVDSMARGWATTYAPAVKQAEAAVEAAKASLSAKIDASVAAVETPVLKG